MKAAERIRRLESSNVRLLVEGANDKYFVAELMKHHGVNYDHAEVGMPYIRDCGGLPSLLSETEVSLLRYQHLGIVLDTDTDQPSDRWNKIAEMIRSAGWDASTEIPKDGFVSERNGRTVGVWLMPDNASEGYLEGLVGMLIPPDDLVWDFSKSCTNEARGKGAPFRSDLSLRASLYTWLAWREKPGRPIGEAIARGWLDANAEAALRFANWFKRVFPNSQQK